jgi:uncharacterized protein YdbL (DUF1318 family)
MNRNLVWTLLLAVCTGALWAQEPNLNVNTPAVRTLKEAMDARAATMAKFKDAGQIGEGRDGLLAVRTMEGLGLGDKKGLEDLIAAENADRRALYKEILTANGLTDAEAGRVMAQAARARYAAAAPGHYVQDMQTGAWVQKSDLK